MKYRNVTGGILWAMIFILVFFGKISLAQVIGLAIAYLAYEVCFEKREETKHDGFHMD